MLTRIEVAGLRGKTLDLELEPITLVIGQNTAGKTTVADAIRWALLGYIPGMDQPPRGWAELIPPSQDIVAIVAHLDGRRTIERGMRLEKGSVRMTNVPNVGGWETVNLLTLDPQKFLAASGPARAALLAEATTAAFDWKAVVPSHLYAGEGSARFKQSKFWPSWLDGVLNVAKMNRGAAADKKRMLTQTLRGLEDLRGLVIADETELKAKLDQGKEQAGALKEQLRAVTLQIAKIKGDEVGQSEANQKLAAVRHALQEFLGHEHDADSFDERYEACEAALKELEAQISERPSKRELEAMKAQEAKIAENVQKLLSTIQARQDTLKLVKAKYAKLKKEKCCPTCGAKGKDFAEAIKLAEETETEAATKSIQATQALLDEERNNLTEMQQRVNDGEGYWGELESLQDQFNELRDEGKLIELWKTHDQLVQTVEAETRQYDLQGLEERRYDISCDLEDTSEANEELEKELAEIGYKRSQKKQLEEIERELVKAEEAWNEANEEVKELEALRSRLTAMSMEPILGAMAQFTKLIFTEPLAFDGTELGRMIGSRWVPLEQFSGSEQAVAIAALSCALRGDPGRENLVLADELSSFDDAHLGQFLNNVAEAIKAGVLSQFIGFSIPRKNKWALPKEVTIRTI